MTRLGCFLKVMVTNFLTKIAQIYGNVLGFFQNITFLVKTTLTTITVTLENLGLLYFLTSGHTGSETD